MFHINVRKTEVKRIVGFIISFFDPCVAGYRPTLCEASKSPIRPLKFRLISHTVRPFSIFTYTMGVDVGVYRS